jgi:hypothetical protein
MPEFIIPGEDDASVFPEFFKKNTNCLEGMKCPQCGSYYPFAIKATSVFLVYDSGTESYSNVEWDDESRCVCDRCDFTGKVKEFKTSQ